MKTLSSSAQQAIDDIARRHGFSPEAVASMLASLMNGNGRMAQFNHPEFSGTGQWMHGGMTMVSDLSNNQLKGRVDGLCAKLSKLMASQPNLVGSESSQSPSESGSPLARNASGDALASGMAPSSLASEFIPAAADRSPGWWPAELRQPDSTGAQNGMRYAYFSQAHRLAF